MIRKVLSAVLICALLACAFAGCSTVNDIAGSVADAAMQELEEQVKAALEKHKVDIIEMKTVFGKLNDDGSDMQFFTAALVKSDSTALPQGAADALDKIVTEAGLLTQSASKVDSPYLVHKDITFAHSDFSAGGYYVIYAYHADLTAGLPNLGN